MLLDSDNMDEDLMMGSGDYLTGGSAQVDAFSMRGRPGTLSLQLAALHGCADGPYISPYGSGMVPAGPVDARVSGCTHSGAAAAGSAGPAATKCNSTSSSATNIDHSPAVGSGTLMCPPQWPVSQPVPAALNRSSMPALGGGTLPWGTPSANDGSSHRGLSMLQRSSTLGGAAASGTATMMQAFGAPDFGTADIIAHISMPCRSGASAKDAKWSAPELVQQGYPAQAQLVPLPPLLPFMGLYSQQQLDAAAANAAWIAAVQQSAPGSPALQPQQLQQAQQSSLLCLDTSAGLSLSARGSPRRAGSGSQSPAGRRPHPRERRLSGTQKSRAGSAHSTRGGPVRKPLPLSSTGAITVTFMPKLAAASASGGGAAATVPKAAAAAGLDGAVGNVAEPEDPAVCLGKGAGTGGPGLPGLELGSCRTKAGRVVRRRRCHDIDEPAADSDLEDNDEDADYQASDDSCDEGQRPRGGRGKGGRGGGRGGGGDDSTVHFIRPHKGGEKRGLTKAALARVYHLPINEAADSLGIGVTVLKKYCRKFCIPRWPYRKLKSMDKLIESLQAYQATGLDTDDEAQGILQQLRSFREMICANPNIDIEDRIKRLRQANFKMEYKQRQQGSGGGALATSPTGGAQMLSLGAGGLLSLPSLLGVNGAGRACSVTEDDKSDEDGDDATDDIDIVELPTCNTEGC